MEQLMENVTIDKRDTGTTVVLRRSLSNGVGV
jgi:hypothetical protein